MIQDIFVSKGSSYTYVTVYYHLRHQPMVAVAKEQHTAYNIAQNAKNLLFCPVYVYILNINDWLKEGLFKSPLLPS